MNTRPIQQQDMTADDIRATFAALMRGLAGSRISPEEMEKTVSAPTCHVSHLPNPPCTGRGPRRAAAVGRPAPQAIERAADVGS